MSLKQIWSAWDQFWFSTTSPLSVAVFRIFFGLLVLVHALLLLSDMYVWFGARGAMNYQTCVDWANHMVTMNILNFFPNSDTWMVCVMGILIVSSISLMIGLKPRIACAIVFICLTSLYHRNPFIYNSGDTYMRACSFWLIFADSGAMLSVDSILARRKNLNKGPDDSSYVDDYGPEVSIWPLRLLQIHLLGVYCHTYFKKVVGDVWINGEAVYYSSRIEDLYRFPVPFVFDNMLLCQILTYGTLIVEFCLFTLIWIKELRYWILGLATCMHLAIEYHMNIPEFEWWMIASYVLFVYPKDLAPVLRRIHAWFAPKPKKDFAKSSTAADSTTPAQTTSAELEKLESS